MSGDDGMRGFVSRLFGTDHDDADAQDFAGLGRPKAAPDEEPRTMPSNHVPGEGNNPSPTSSTSGDMREFASALFDRAHLD